MLWIGLTGGIATGKSTVSNYIEELGWPVVDADLVAREVVQKGSEGLGEVVKAFGPEILTPDGTLDRAQMRKLVFKDQQKRQLLEGLLHPRIQRRTAQKRDELEASGYKVAVYDVPLLFEKNLQGQFDQTVLVYVAPELQRQRLMARDGISQDDADRLISSQMPIDQKRPLATRVIENSGTKKDLQAQVQELVQEIESQL